MGIQKIETKTSLKERIETGPLKINDDWAGYFIRGDSAGWMAMQATLIEKELSLLSEEEKAKLPFFELSTLLMSIKHFGESREI